MLACVRRATLRRIADALCVADGVVDGFAGIVGLTMSVTPAAIGTHVTADAMTTMPTCMATMTNLT